MCPKSSYCKVICGVVRQAFLSRVELDCDTIEAAIKQLPEGDVCQRSVWLQEYLDGMWDRQIEADLAVGKLDNLIAKAEADIAANRVRNLDEVFHNT